MKFKYYLIVLMILGFLQSCKKPESSVDGNGGNEISGGVAEVTEVVSDISVELNTDKALYDPGDKVLFKAGTVPSGTRVRYRHEGEVILDQELAETAWEWTAPSEDFQGYLVELYRREEKKEIIIGTIAVDVSSDWTRFPRYGYVADFDSSKLKDGVIEGEMSFLNRCHVNGIQFYDWHNKHHWPLGGTREKPAEVYKDIANRDVYAAAVRKYIKVLHGYGMKAMFYNLCFGALDDAAEDGVKKEWYAYNHTGGVDPDHHVLPDSWKSDIYVLDPANREWLDYLAERNDDVYAQYDFDGFHIDQLGYRGNRYTYSGQLIDFPRGYADFINAMKRSHPAKRLVMNAVGGYGALDIAGTGKVDFLYNEVWDNQREFKDLHMLIKSNDIYSGHTKNTVFAAYMNYGCSHRDFNVPGVLLTDAVMFALGGAHLELGDHMLCREYFPNKDVQMSSALKVQIVRYYDFMTAYQTLLRGMDSSAETAPEIKVAEKNARTVINAWPPQKGKIGAYSKKIGKRKIIHLLNFLSVDETSWRDVDGTMPVPRQVRNLKVKVKADAPVKRIWTASPDIHAGACQDLVFEQRGGYVYFTVPMLKYWNMLVFEYDRT